MPSISTRGAATVYGYASFTVKVLPSGSFGVFITSNASSPIMSYNFATDATSFIGNLGTPETYYGAAVGNAELGLICLAGVGAPFTNTKRLTFSTMTFASGASLLNDMSAGSAFGIQDRAIIAVAYFATTTNKYQYATNTMSAATAILVGSVYISALSAPTFGVTQVGNGGNSGSNKYRYSDDTVATTTAFTSTGAGAAAGNATLGIIGFPTAVSSLYTYANDTTIAGPALASKVGAACSNANIAVFSRADNIGTVKYDLVGGVASTGTSLQFAAVGSLAVSNGITGVNS